MKTRVNSILMLLLIAGSMDIRGQTYSIDWYTIDGGGGTSTGGVYSVSGTISQPDAGVLIGGNFTVRGGLWVAPMPIQVEDAPWLSIARTTDGALISWEPPTPGWILQFNTDLSSTNWVNAASGETNPVTIPTAPTVRFFRLHKP